MGSVLLVSSRSYGQVLDQLIPSRRGVGRVYLSNADLLRKEHFDNLKHIIRDSSTVAEGGGG